MKINFPLYLVLSVSFFFQPSLQAQTEPEFLKQLGKVDHLFSHILNESRELYVQLPEGFHPEESNRYPLVIVLDGEVLLPAVHVAQEFFQGGYLPEMILVGISNTKNRTRDLTPSKIQSKYGMPFEVENGEAENFMQFIEKELLPYLDQKYPTTPYRTLIGHSYGGLFTINALLNHPTLFANYLAIDPSLDWDDQKAIHDAKRILPKADWSNKGLFISLSGQLHMQKPEVTIENVMQDTTDFTLFARSNISFSEIVKQNNKNGLSFTWKFYPDDLHGTVAAPSILEGMKSLFSWFQMEDTYKINDPNTSIKSLDAIVRKRAKKLENHFSYGISPYPEDLFNMLGYMSLEMGQPEKSKLFFDFAIEFFPNSANAHDSMSEFYEQQEDLENALKHATMAYELNDSEYQLERINKLKERQ